MENKKLLLVDDEYQIRKVLKDKLVRNGFQVETAADGTNALAALISNSFDLVIVDMQMPNMSGGELIQSVREAGHKCKIIVISAFGDKKTVASVAKYDISAWMVKPFKEEELLGKINEVLSS